MLLRSLPSHLLAVVLLTFFFMVYGENLQRNAIALLPGRQQKKFTVEILHSIEREVSRYVLTISIINTVPVAYRRRAIKYLQEGCG